MPLGERVVQPVNLGAKPLDLLDQEKGTTHLAVATNSLIGALLQLASLVRHADDIFCDISDECQKVFDRADRVARKLQNVEVCVKQLDAKNVLIPVGDLSSFTQVDDHHVSKHGFDCDLFTVETRPACIKDQFAMAEVSPSRILRGADMYRKDGLCSSRLFRLWPVALREPEIKTPDLNLPRKSPSVFTFEKRYKRLKERPKTIHVSQDTYFSKEDQERETQEMSESLSQSKSASLITIDTSGAGFQRMESLRSSQRSIEFKEKRKKRRRTVSGVSDHIMREIEQFEKKKKPTTGPRDHPRNYSFDDSNLDDIDRDEEMAKYLGEIEAKMEERKEEEYALKGPKFMKMFPCRRSKSLPRCLKLHSISKALAYDKQSTTDKASTHHDGSSLSLSSLGSISSRLSRSTKRSSIISSKLKLLVSGNSSEKASKKDRPRPKSLDLDAMDFGEETTCALSKNKMPSMPDGILHCANSDSRKYGPGSYYNFESNTLPRRQTKRHEYPWEGMPKDWTSSVKLREIRRRSRDERQSSSGNWSGSSSNRHSLDSDVKAECILKSASQGSLEHDSGRDSPIAEDDSGRSRCGTDTTGGYAGDDASTISGGKSDSCSLKDPKLETDIWLQNLAARAASREEVSSSSAETLSSLTRLTKQNILALDLMMSPSKRRPCCYLDDEESSVYSVDGEGFYTSFHNDSGLRRSNGTLVDEDDLSPTRESQDSFESVIHTSDSDKFAGFKRGGTAQQGQKGVISKVNPPAPPPRTSSCNSLSKSGNGEKSAFSPPDGISRQDSSSLSESDQESIYMRLKMKTQISSTNIPLMCPLSSDEESLLGKRSPDSNDNEKVLDLNQNFNKGRDAEDSSIFSVSTFDGSIISESTAIDDTFDLSSELSYSTLLGENSSTDSTSKTLPRSFTTKPAIKDSYDYTKSWPRVNKKFKGGDTSQTPISGILKNSDRSLSGPKPPKSLNFSPVVNMFNPGTPQAVQMPLPSSPNSSKDGGRKGTSPLSPDSGTYKLSVPLSDENLDKPNLPLKYQPVIVVKPGTQNKESNSEKKGAYVKLTPDMPLTQSKNIGPYASSSVTMTSSVASSSRSTNHYAVSPVKNNIVSSTENVKYIGKKNMHSPVTATDSGYMEMPVNGSAEELGGTKSNEENKALSHGLGSMLSIESADSINFTGGTNSIGISSECSSPNLSNFEVDVVNTPTGSMNSLVEPSKFDGDFISIDNSNVSTTIETIAISTNSTSSFSQNDSINSGHEKSFRTFTGPVSPPMSTSTPCAPPVGGQYSHQHRTQSRYRKPENNVKQNEGSQRPTSSMWPQRKPLTTSRSMPSEMTKYGDVSSSGKLPKSSSDRRRSSDNKIAPVVNVQKESVEDSGLNRSESYRVAMGNITRNSSYRVAMVESKSCPSFQDKVQQRISSPVASVAPNVRNSPSLSSNSRNSPSSLNTSKNNPNMSSNSSRCSPASASNSSRNSPNMSSNSSRCNSVTASNSSRNSPNMSSKNSANMSSHQSRTNMSLSSNQSPRNSPNLSSHNQRTSTYKPKTTSASSSSYTNQSDQTGAVKSSSYYSPKILPPPQPAEDFNRTDSYRYAVINTHGVVSADSQDIMGRNSSYRVAIHDLEPVMMDDRLGMGQLPVTNGRDVRRMGITDVDQLKGIPEKPRDQSHAYSSNGVKLRRPAKKGDVDPISVLSSMESNHRSKSSKNRHSTSSTYICFDPIFEDREDLTGSIDSLRTPTGSMSSLKTSPDNYVDSNYYGDSFYGNKSKVNIMGSGKSSSSGKNTISSLFSKGKSFGKQKSSSQVSKDRESDDDVRFTMV